MGFGAKQAWALFLIFLFDEFRRREHGHKAGSPESESRLRCFLLGVT